MPALHIGTPNYRGVVEQQHHKCMGLLLHALGQQRRGFNWVGPTGTIVGTARQECVNQLLSDPEGQYLFFIDDDMTFEVEDFFRLEKYIIENDLDYVTGLCFSNEIPTKPCIFGMVEGCTEMSDEHLWWNIMTDYPRDQLFEIYMSGLAFAVISKRMLNEMRKIDDRVVDFPKYSHFHMDHIYVQNEDLAFCIKARQAGFKLHCDSSVKIGHISKSRPIINEAIWDMHGDAIEYAKEIPRSVPVSPDKTWMVRHLNPEITQTLAEEREARRVGAAHDGR